MNRHIGKTLLLLSVLIHAIVSYEVKSFWVWTCPGRTISSASCDLGVLQIRSITVFSSTKTDEIISVGTDCKIGSPVHQCERRITTSDTGLSDTYKFFYKWCVSKCEGKRACDPIKVPPYWDLVGETNNPARFLLANNTVQQADCPLGGTKYVSGIYIHFECREGEEIVTVSEPPPTTPRTRPTTPTTTTAFPVFYAVYLPGLEDREKIILGIAIGLAIAILIVLLLILYCWERWRRQKKFGKLLRMLGRPQAMNDGFDEFDHYGTPEAWKDETNNADAIGEYTGVKPDEFLTIDRQHMEKSGLIFSDHVGTITTMGRANTASTLNKNGAVRRPSLDPGMGYNNEAIDYETEENLELERRMAAVLDKQESVLSEVDGEDMTKH